MSPRKRPVYVTRDMQIKIATEYAAASRYRRGDVARRYGVSQSSALRWVKLGLAVATTAMNSQPPPQQGGFGNTGRPAVAVRPPHGRNPCGSRRTRDLQVGGR